MDASVARAYIRFYKGIKMPVVSVIIPVYNAEKYLHRCLDSLLNQTFTDWTAICINDGSRDASAEILAEYAALDARFVVINKPNAGVSAARNDGLAAARGEYIHFMDADDFIDADYYEKMLAALRATRADVAASGFVSDVKYTRGMQYATGRIACGIRQIFWYTNAMSYSYIWRYLFSRDLILRAGALFPTHMRSQEDAVFLLNLLAVADSVVTVPETFYHYVYNDASALNSRDAAHRARMKIDYVAGKKFRRDFACAHGLVAQWRMRKLLNWPIVARIFRGWK